ncbi:MAG: hypothetical protein J6Y94_04570, partial [Bacteriovoracaceae bacterium]|nr:hypothetical protein [Bacteriovoracaceae bacterium]
MNGPIFLTLIFLLLSPTLVAQDLSGRPSFGQSSSANAFLSSFQGAPGTTLSLKGDQRLVARSDWPHEFILLLDDLQEHLLTREEQDQFLLDLLQLDQAYSALAKNHKDSLHFLTKAIIYKGLLNWRPKVIIGPNLYSSTTTATLKQRLSTETFSPFLTWFLSAIERDLRIYLAESTPKAQQAAAMALAWYQSCMTGPASFELDLYAAVRKTWHHLAEQLYLLAFFTVSAPENRVSFKVSTSLPLKNFAKAAVIAAATESPAATIRVRKRIPPALAALW